MNAVLRGGMSIPLSPTKISTLIPCSATRKAKERVGEGITQCKRIEPQYENLLEMSPHLVSHLGDTLDNAVRGVAVAPGGERALQQEGPFFGRRLNFNFSWPAQPWLNSLPWSLGGRVG